MKHYLTFKDDKSDKFWQIETDGKSFTVTYGKTGSTGTKQIKKFTNETLCLKEANKLLAEKKKKGYSAQKEASKKEKPKTKAPLVVDNKKIMKLLQSNKLNEIEEGILLLDSFTQKKKSHDNNPISKFFNINKDDFDETELIEIDVLDSILSKSKAKLSADAVMAVIRSTMGLNIYDNFSSTIKAVQIGIERKDVSIQKVVVESFKQACVHYDAGHRLHENTVQDQLIDDLFPQFEGEPLVELLTWCKTDFLHRNYDGMDALFKPAFIKIKGNQPLEKKLLKFFVEYLEECDDAYKKSGILNGFDEASETVKATMNELSGGRSLDKLISTYYRKGISWSKQYEIIVSLKEHNDPKAIRLLLEALNHEEGAVVRESIHSLGHLKIEEAVPQIIAKLKSKNGQHISAAAFALSKINNEACLSALRDEKNYKYALKITKDEDLDEGSFSVQSLQYFIIKTVNDDLLSLLINADDSEVQEEAKEGLIFRVAEDMIEPYADYITSNELVEDNGRTLIELILGIAAQTTVPDQKKISPIAKILSRISTEDLQTLIDEAEYPLQELERKSKEEKTHADVWCKLLISFIKPEEKQELVKKVLLLN